MKCWNSAFNAQGLRYIIVVVVQVGAVKIYAAAVDALRKKREEGVKTGWNSVYHKKMVHFWVSTPPLPYPPLLRLMYFLAGYFLNLTRFWTKLRVPTSGAVFPQLYGKLHCMSQLIKKCLCDKNNIIAICMKLQGQLKGLRMYIYPHTHISTPTSSLFSGPIERNTNSGKIK